VGIIVSLIAIIALYGNVTLEPKPISGDARQNIVVGLHLSQDGVYRENLDDPVYYRREPFYPFLIAAMDRTRGLLGMERIPTACGELDESAWEPCPEILAQFKFIGVTFLVVAAGAACLLVFALTGSYVLSLAAWSLTVASQSLLTYADRNITEVHAAALVTLVALFGVYAVTRRSMWLFAVFGLVLGLLVLTKTIFSIFWVPAALIILAMGWKACSAKRLAASILVFVVCANVLPVAWMTRNALVGGDFELTERRSFGVLSIRASYDTMTPREALAAFFFYTPSIGKRGMEKWGFEEADYTRFDTKNEDGFRRTGQKQYRARMAELQEEYYPVADAETANKNAFADDVIDQVGREARERILSDPIAHLRATIVLAYRAMFPELGFGYRPTKDPLQSADWLSAPPRPVYSVRRPDQTSYNLATGLALLLVPLIGWLRNRDLSPLMAFLPAIYLHGAYAAATHFLPRYAYPELPLRAAALCVLAYYLLSFVWETFSKLPRHNRSEAEA
jgi:hypothetical protein